MFIALKYQKLFVQTLEKGKKFKASPVSFTVNTDNFYFDRHRTYLVLILKCQEQK